MTQAGRVSCSAKICPLSRRENRMPRHFDGNLDAMFSAHGAAGGDANLEPSFSKSRSACFIGAMKPMAHDRPRRLHSFPFGGKKRQVMINLVPTR